MNDLSFFRAEPSLDHHPVDLGGQSLTAAQTAMWLDQAFYPGRPIYNTGQTIRIKTPLRLDCFEAALRQTVAEHDGLRLRFLQHGARVVQHVEAEAEMHLAWHDFSVEPNPEAASAAWVSQQF